MFSLVIYCHTWFFSALRNGSLCAMVKFFNIEIYFSSLESIYQNDCSLYEPIHSTIWIDMLYTVELMELNRVMWVLFLVSVFIFLHLQLPCWHGNSYKIWNCLFVSLIQRLNKISFICVLLLIVDKLLKQVCLTCSEAQEWWYCFCILMLH